MGMHRNNKFIIFSFGLEPNQRILTLDMAISLWKLVFTVHTPQLIDNWLYFLEQHPSIRGIPKDTWNMFLNFCDQCDIDNYDDTEAWPSLFDDFVDYERARLAEAAAKKAAAAEQQQQSLEQLNNAFAYTNINQPTTAANSSMPYDDDNNNDDHQQKWETAGV